MTVSELIEELRQRPQDAQVVIDAGGREVDLESRQIGIKHVATRGSERDQILVVLRTYGPVSDE